jgi:hypothetical protein
MNDDKNERERFVSEVMGRFRVSEPSDELKDRVLEAAREAWVGGNEGAEKVAWFPPVLRLAASIIFLIGLLTAGNHLGDRSLAKWRLQNEPTVVRNLEVAELQGFDLSRYAILNRVSANNNRGQAFASYLRQFQDLERVGS